MSTTVALNGCTAEETRVTCNHFAALTESGEQVSPEMYFTREVHIDDLAMTNEMACILLSGEIQCRFFLYGDWFSLGSYFDRMWAAGRYLCASARASVAVNGTSPTLCWGADEAMLSDDTCDFLGGERVRPPVETLRACRFASACVPWRER